MKRTIICVALASLLISVASGCRNNNGQSSAGSNSMGPRSTGSSATPTTDQTTDTGNGRQPNGYGPSSRATGGGSGPDSRRQ